MKALEKRRTKRKWLTDSLSDQSYQIFSGLLVESLSKTLKQEKAKELFLLPAIHRK
jgi:hypothetical protein